MRDFNTNRRPDLRDFMRPIDYDRDDYRRGYQLGLAGYPDQMGRANWATWQGWRDGFVDGGYAVRYAPKPQLRLVK